MKASLSSLFRGRATASSQDILRATERLSDLRGQGRRLERSLLTRLQGSNLDEHQLANLKACYQELRQALAAPNPATLDGFEAVVAPLYQSIQTAREAIDALQPSQKLGTSARQIIA